MKHFVKNKALQNAKLQRSQRSIIVGKLLGDGNLKQNGTLTIDQSLKQANYVEKTYEALSPFVGKPPVLVNRQYKDRPATQSVRFSTPGCFKGFHNRFYQQINSGNKFKKIVPAHVEGLVDATALAIWYCDDGTLLKNGTRGCAINVSSFDDVSRVRLVDMLKNKFKINARINKSGVSKKGNQQWVLVISDNQRIGAYDFTRFMNLIKSTGWPQQFFPYKLV